MGLQCDKEYLKMNSSIKVLFFCFLASAQAKWVREAHMCEGYENAPMQFIDSNSPDEIHLPGQVTLDINSVITEDFPADLVFKLDLEKQEPFPLEVPCLNGLGSCEYPLLANSYNMQGITVDVPDFGILNNLMVGSYKARGTFYGKSTPDNKLGCIEFTFTFVQG